MNSSKILHYLTCPLANGTVALNMTDNQNSNFRKNLESLGILVTIIAVVLGGPVWIVHEMTVNSTKIEGMEKRFDSVDRQLEKIQNSLNVSTRSAAVD